MIRELHTTHLQLYNMDESENVVRETISLYPYVFQALRSRWEERRIEIEMK